MVSLPSRWSRARALWLLCGVGSAVVGCARVDDSACLAWEERDADEVVAVLRAQQDAWNAGDIAGFLDGYVRDEGLVFTSGAKVRRGFEETRKKFESRYGTSKDTMGHLEFEIESVQHMGADGAVVLGRWELTKTAEAGDGIFSVIFARTNEGWKIVHDHTSATPAPASSAASPTPATSGSAIEVTPDPKPDPRPDPKPDPRPEVGPDAGPARGVEADRSQR